MGKSYDLDKPKKEPSRKEVYKGTKTSKKPNTQVKNKIKEEIESYEDVLRREKREKHNKEGVHVV